MREQHHLPAIVMATHDQWENPEGKILDFHPPLSHAIARAVLTGG